EVADEPGVEHGVQIRPVGPAALGQAAELGPRGGGQRRLNAHDRYGRVASGLTASATWRPEKVTTLPRMTVEPPLILDRGGPVPGNGAGRIGSDWSGRVGGDRPGRAGGDGSGRAGPAARDEGRALTEMRPGIPCVAGIDQAAWRRAWRRAGDAAPSQWPDPRG